MCVCARACVRACVRVCVRARACVCAGLHGSAEQQVPLIGLFTLSGTSYCSTVLLYYCTTVQGMFVTVRLYFDVILSQTGYVG